MDQSDGPGVWGRPRLRAGAKGRAQCFHPGWVGWKPGGSLEQMGPGNFDALEMEESKWKTLWTKWTFGKCVRSSKRYEKSEDRRKQRTKPCSMVGSLSPIPYLCQYEAGTRTSREFGHHDMGILKGNKCSRGECSEYKTHEGRVKLLKWRLWGFLETLWSLHISSSLLNTCPVHWSIIKYSMYLYAFSRNFGAQGQSLVFCVVSFAWKAAFVTFAILRICFPCKDLAVLGYGIY